MEKKNWMHNKSAGGMVAVGGAVGDSATGVVERLGATDAGAVFGIVVGATVRGFEGAEVGLPVEPVVAGPWEGVRVGWIVVDRVGSSEGRSEGICVGGGFVGLLSVGLGVEAAGVGVGAADDGSLVVVGAPEGFFVGTAIGWGAGSPAVGLLVVTGAGVGLIASAMAFSADEHRKMIIRSNVSSPEAGKSIIATPLPTQHVSLRVES